MTFVNDEQAEFWSAMAPTWIDLEARLDEVAGPCGQAAMDNLNPAPGSTVLDLGCGAAGTTMQLAARVGPDGRVVGMDIAAEMFAEARARAERLGLANIEFVVGDVQVYPFDDAVFDFAFSRFGVMFYKDPAAAFTNIHRAMKPGGRLAFCCWQDVFQNEWMLVPGMAAGAVLGALPPPAGPGEPGPFSLSDPERVREILSEAGFADVNVEPRNDPISADPARIPELTETSTRFGIVREALRESDEATRVRVADAIAAALAEKVSDGELTMSRGFYVVSATA